MNVTLSDLLSFIRDYGLPLAMALVAIWTGAKKSPGWYFASTVADMKAQYEARLAEKNERIKELLEANAQDGRNAEAALAVAKETKEVIDKLEYALRAGGGNQPPNTRRTTR